MILPDRIINQRPDPFTFFTFQYGENMQDKPLLKRSLINAALLAASLGLTACGSSGGDTGVSITGQWACQTDNGKGNSSSEVWLFKNDGVIKINSGGYTLNGNYDRSGQLIKITITNIPEMAKYGVSTDTNKKMRAMITTLTNSQMEIDTVDDSGVKRSSICTK